MSVAGMLASSLFSNASSLVSQKTSNAGASIANAFESDLQTGNVSGAQSIFSALQQKLSAQGLTAAGSPAAAQISQLGQDLKSSNLVAAQSDFSNLQQTLSHVSQPHHHQNGGTSVGVSSHISNTTASDSLAALQAYSSLQQNPENHTLGRLLSANTRGFSVEA